MSKTFQQDFENKTGKRVLPKRSRHKTGNLQELSKCHQRNSYTENNKTRHNKFLGIKLPYNRKPTEDIVLGIDAFAQQKNWLLRKNRH